MKMLNFEKIYQIFDGRIPCKEDCVECCQREGDVVLLPGEAKFLFKKIPRARKYIYKKRVNGINIELLKLPCPFLAKNGCSIMENRPFDCRAYPFDYCLYKKKLVVITSKSCPALKIISKEKSKQFCKLLIRIVNKIPKKWLKSAVLFGPCGNCNKKDCKLRDIPGFNDKE